ncbi:MAG: hypothetical protein ACI8ZO_001202 [Flavobacteriales bacterium]|jgi:hypothetical protein
MSRSNLRKNVAKIIVLIITVFLGLIIIVPAVYKSEIIALVKDEANKNIKGKLSFGDFDLSLFSSFPNLNLEIRDVSLLGADEFEETYLTKLSALELEINLFKIIRTGNISIQSIGVDKPEINIVVLANGKSNYDITYPSIEDSATSGKEETPSTFEMALEHYEINNAVINYKDASMDMSLNISDFNHQGSGDFTTSVFNLITETNISELTFTYEGVPFLYKVKTDLEAIIGMDLDQMLFTFKDNLLVLNNLPLTFAGFVLMPNDAIEMDLSFSAKNAGFKKLLSLIPAVYSSDMEGLTANGSFSFDGYTKGIYNDTNFPAFGAKLSLENGDFKYIDLPTGLKNATVDMHLDFPGGNDLDLVKVDLKKFTATVENNPIFASFKISKPMTSLNFEAQMKGKFDFEKLAALVPLDENKKMAGLLNIDAKVKGDMESIENENYDKIQFMCAMNLRQFKYNTTLLPESLYIAQLEIIANQTQVDLKFFQMNIGDSDINATGKLNNFIGYALSDKTLSGNLTVNSKNLNIDALMPSETEGEADIKNKAKEELALIEVPDNLDLSMLINLDKMLYDKVSIENVKGGITLKNGKAELKDMRLKVLNGNIVMNGSYVTPTSTSAEMDFGFKLSGLDLNITANTFNTIAAFAPIAKYTQGLFDASFSFKGNLDKKMNPVLNSLNGSGDFFSKSIGLKGFKPLSGIGNALKLKGFEEQKFNNVAVKYSFNDGKFNVKPFDVKIGNTNAKVSGTTGVDQSIDYKVAMALPSNLIAGNSAISSLLGSASGLGNMDVDILIGGTVLKPTFNTSLKGMVKNIVEGSKDKVKELAQEKVDEAKAKAQAELNKRADELMLEANKQANKLRQKAKDAGDKVKEEAKKQADRLIENAGSNPLKKKAAELTGNKLQDEADKKAIKLEEEGEAKAQTIIKNAEQQADKLRN